MYLREVSQGIKPVHGYAMARSHIRDPLILGDTKISIGPSRSLAYGLVGTLALDPRA